MSEPAQSGSCQNILYVGRLERAEGARHAIWAFDLVQHLFPDARLTMVGTESQSTEVRDLAQGLEVASSVQFLGNRADLADIEPIEPPFAVTPLTVSVEPLSVSVAGVFGTEGVAFSGLVATFRDANAAALPADFRAMIDWGDGQASEGVVTLDPVGGRCIVEGQ